MPGHATNRLLNCTNSCRSSVNRGCPQAQRGPLGQGRDGAVAVAALIAAQRDQHRIPHVVSCRALGVSQAWFYKWSSHARAGTLPPRAARRARLAAEVRRLFEAYDGKRGSPMITADLQDDGWRVSKNTVAALMAEQNLVARPKRRRKSTTRPGRGRWRAPDRSSGPIRCPVRSVWSEVVRLVRESLRKTLARCTARRRLLRALPLPLRSGPIRLSVLLVRPPGLGVLDVVRPTLDTSAAAGTGSGISAAGVVSRTTGVSKPKCANNRYRKILPSVMPNSTPLLPFQPNAERSSGALAGGRAGGPMPDLLHSLIAANYGSRRRESSTSLRVR